LFGHARASLVATLTSLVIRISVVTHAIFTPTAKEGGCNNSLKFLLAKTSKLKICIHADF